MYSALKSAGAPVEKARDGASVLSDLDKEIIKIKAEHRLTHLLLSINIILTFFSIALIVKKLTN
jgi:hypothetical protein